MTKILAGQPAPTFTLAGMDGKQWSLAEALRKGPVVFAFFKVSCPVCQFTFPFVERLYQAYGGDRVSFWGISQDGVRDTRDFCKEYGVTFPALIDGRGYPVSNQYGLTTVPTVFLVMPDGTVRISSVGFCKADLEQVSSELARHLGGKLAPVFLPDEAIPDYKPG